MESETNKPIGGTFRPSCNSKTTEPLPFAALPSSKLAFDFSAIANAFESVIEIARECGQALFVFSPFVPYARAGYPYGKTMRGFKKWRRKLSA